MLTKLLTQIEKSLHRNHFDKFVRVFKSLSLRHEHHPKRVVFFYTKMDTVI